MNPSKKNIWIFGGTGFIGKALLNKLSENSQNNLHLLIHKNIPYQHLEYFNTFTGSLTRFDLSWLEKYPPDVIYHLARLGGRNFLTRTIASQKGAKANSRLISFLSQMRYPPIVVYVSGSLMYGNQKNGNFANEFTPLSPVSYAKTYIQGEKPWIAAQHNQTSDVRFARPGWIVGNGSWFKSFYWNVFLKTGKVPIYGDGNQLMSVIHVEDCAGQIIHLAEYGEKNQNFNIFCGNPVTQNIFAMTLSDLLKADTEPVQIETLSKKYGNTVTQAFNTSIPLKTKFPELANSYSFLYPDLKSIIAKTLSGLEHDKAVFPPTP
jgi:nucleoside-diphosphate-sugar epimerase